MSKKIVAPESPERNCPAEIKASRFVLLWAMACAAATSLGLFLLFAL